MPAQTKNESISQVIVFQNINHIKKFLKLSKIGFIFASKTFSIFMENISVFDMLKIGVGPSSSHTLGPWRAAQMMLERTKNDIYLSQITKLNITLYGSLSLTGKGHATDLAVILGLSGYDPVNISIEKIQSIIDQVKSKNILTLNNQYNIPFSFKDDIIFKRDFLPFHANALTFNFYLENRVISETYYSVGGGFVTQESQEELKELLHHFPYPINNGAQILDYCNQLQCSVSDLVLKNELSLRSAEQIHNELITIWDTMLECMYIGCHTEGILPGGLQVKRRAFEMHQKLMSDINYNTPHEWLTAIRKTEVKFRAILRWVSCFALAVNEVNASLGRVVTAPTNGSAGVIPAVLMYYLVIENHQADETHIKKFLLTAGEIGSIFKKGATISAAMGGCQAEIGVSSAMAAGALCELLGGSPEQVLMAAEIAMEHHLGLTCDPIGGLVQIPCIERNSMGAIKAINAAELAIESDAKAAKVPIDKVIKTMWETAQDMHTKYKETSQGGLAIGVGMTDC